MAAEPRMEEWAPPRFEPKARVRRLPIIHPVAEAIYRLPLWLAYMWLAIRSPQARRTAATLAVALFTLTGVVLAVALAVAR